jgi:branched-chain amino acid transport system permease protein
MNDSSFMRPAVILLFVAALAAAPFAVNQGLLFLIGIAMLQAMFALSWNLMFRYAGLASFGHAMFYGIGGYAVAAIIFHGFPLPFLLAILVSTAIGAIVAFVVALIILQRAAGIQLAVLTLALSQLVLLFVSYTDFLGRDDGLSGLARPVLDFGLFVLDLRSPTAFYYFIMVAFGLVTVGLLWFVSGRFGRVLLAVRIDSERAAFLGVDVRRKRIFVFTLAGAIASFAGALAAPWAQIISTDSMSWFNSAQPMLATLLGGAGSYWGPVIGAFGLILVNYFTRTFVGLSEFMVGGILLFVVLLAPSGIAGFFEMVRRMRNRTRTVSAREQNQ